jgi:hypothetical protein
MKNNMAKTQNTHRINGKISRNPWVKLEDINRAVWIRKTN